MADEITAEEAQEAVENGDEVSHDELSEMHPNKTMGQIFSEIAAKQSAEELESKIASIYSFDEPRFAARQGRKTYHTGPKGVLTDYEEAKLKMRANRLNDKLKREQRKYMNIDNSDYVKPFQLIDTKNNKLTSKELRKERKLNSLKNEQKNDSDEEAEEDILDDELLKEYKMQRLKVLHENMPRFGDTKEVTAFTFDKEVEKAPKNVFVVIHIYQDYLERCTRMNYALNQIAIAYPHIKFLRGRTDRMALDKYPDIGLPTLIVFKNGDQLQNHIAVHTIIGNPFMVSDVEKFLIKHNVLKPTISIPDQYTFKQNKEKEVELKTLQKKKNNISIQSNFHKNQKFKTEDSDSELDID